MKKRKKYAIGSTVKSHLEKPDDVVTRLNISADKARYEAESNPWIKGLQVGGSLLTDLGINMLAPTLGPQATQLLKTGATGYEGAMMMALGGQVPGIPIEAEGGEAAQMPNGQLLDIQGASHSQGGVDLTLPEGTEIYSKRIKIDGVSMADRKKKRESKTITLDKLLEKRKHDTLLANTKKLTSQNNKFEEDSDTKIQNFISQFVEADEKGGLRPKFWAGSTVGDPGITLPVSDEELLLQGLGSVNRIDPSHTSIFGEYPTEVPSVKSSIGEGINKRFEAARKGEIKDPTTIPLRPSSPKLQVDAVGPTRPSQARLLGQTALESINSGDAEMPTFGDSASLVGSLISSFGPYLNTLKNRAGDAPNRNFFSSYGEDSLNTYDESMRNLEGLRERSLQDARFAGNATQKSMRNSARGVNSMRSFDIASQNQRNSNSNEIYNNFAQQMGAMLQSKAGVQGQIDQIRMGGEQAKDIANRHDRDQFYSNKAKDLTNMGFGMQNIGQDINQIKYRGDTTNMINELAANGITMADIQAFLQARDGTTLKTATVPNIAKTKTTKSKEGN